MAGAVLPAGLRSICVRERRFSRPIAKTAGHDHIESAGARIKAGIQGIPAEDAGVIDETPMASRDIDAVMAAQEDLVEVVHTLKQIVCVKG